MWPAQRPPGIVPFSRAMLEQWKRDLRRFSRDFEDAGNRFPESVHRIFVYHCFLQTWGREGPTDLGLSDGHGMGPAGAPYQFMTHDGERWWHCLVDGTEDDSSCAREFLTLAQKAGKVLPRECLPEDLKKIVLQTSDEKYPVSDEDVWTILLYRLGLEHRDTLPFKVLTERVSSVGLEPVPRLEAMKFPVRLRANLDMDPFSASAHLCEFLSPANFMKAQKDWGAAKVEERERIVMDAAKRVGHVVSAIARLIVEESEDATFEGVRAWLKRRNKETKDRLYRDIQNIQRTAGE